LRLAYFADTPRLGGAERFLVNVVAGAVAAGHDVTVLSPQVELLELVGGETGSRLVRTGPRDVWKVSSPRGKLGTLMASLPLVGVALARTRADLLHVNNGGYPGSELCRAASVLGRPARIPRRLLTVHSAPWPRTPSHPHLHAALDRLVWRSADAVHATTTYVERGLSDLRGMPPALGRHIAYGVPEPPGSDESPGLRSRLATRGLLVAMIAATADAQKGHAVLVDALARVETGLSAVVVGPVPDGLRARVEESGLAGRLTLTGAVAPDAVGAYLHAADAIVVPSTAYESLPLVVLEAMAAGKPVFASRLSGIPEAVVDRQTGFLFTPGAVDELVELLRAAANGSARLEELGRLGRARWRERYSLEAMTRAMLALYNDLARRSPITSS
jgi:glycosyltransferase involved in cell wall biosynthesis